MAAGGVQEYIARPIVILPIVTVATMVADMAFIQTAMATTAEGISILSTSTITTIYTGRARTVCIREITSGMCATNDIVTITEGKTWPAITATTTATGLIITPTGTASTGVRKCRAG